MRVAQQWHQETTRHGNISALVSSAIKETTVNDNNLGVEESEASKGMRKYNDDDDDDADKSDADCRGDLYESRSYDSKEIDDSQLDNGLLVLKSSKT